MSDDAKKPTTVRFALLYAGGLAILLGLAVGVTALLFVFLEGFATKLSTLAAGGAVTVAGGFIFKRLPPVQERHRYVAGSLGIIVVLALWIGEGVVLGLGLPNPVPGADAHALPRLLRLESDLQRLESTLWSEAYREELSLPREGQRAWLRVPVDPGRSYAVRVELSGIPHDASVELVAMDARGALLAGRRGRGRSSRFMIRARSTWNASIGVRWWSTRASRDDDGVASSAERAVLARVTVVPAAAREEELASSPARVTLRDGEHTPVEQLTHLEAASSCVGTGPAETFAFAVDRAAWVVVDADSTSQLALAVYVRSSADADSAREVACGAEVVAVDGGADGRARLRSRLTLALPAGEYVAVLSGLASGAPPLSTSIFKNAIEAVDDRGSSEIVVSRGAAAHVARVDLISGAFPGSSADIALTLRDIPVRVESRGGYRAVLAGPTGTTDAPAHDDLIQLAWLGAEQRRITRFGAAPYAELVPRTDAWLRVAAPASAGPLLADVRIVRVPPGPEDLERACGQRPLIELGRPWQGAITGGTSQLALDACEPGARLRQDGHIAAGPESLATLDLSADSAVRIDVRAEADLNADAEELAWLDLVAYVIDACDPAAHVVACNDDRGPGGRLDPLIHTELPRGRYVLVVDGYGPRDAGNFIATVQARPTEAPIAEW